MMAILFISISAFICSCSPIQVADKQETKYPNTPTMGDADRASAGSL
jgi:hypothetical protein